MSTTAIIALLSAGGLLGVANLCLGYWFGRHSAADLERLLRPQLGAAGLRSHPLRAALARG